VSKNIVLRPVSGCALYIYICMYSANNSRKGLMTVKTSLNDVIVVVF